MHWEEYKKEIEAKGQSDDWYILGIDLGTTNSVISYWDNMSKKPEPIDTSNGFGKIPLPSVVQFRPQDDGEDEWVVGEEAYRSIKIYPKTTIRSIKRKMGTNETVDIDGKKYLPEEISAKILSELVEYCYSLNPKAEIAGIVLGIPYDFDDSAKKATMRAAEIAGLADKLICLMEEPKAAALAYNFRRQLEADEKILVFDFGGGTLDITLFHVEEKTDSSIKLRVISEGGEAYHGGDNIDEQLLQKNLQLIAEKIGQTRDDIAPENMAELILRSREAKERLSGVKTFRIPFTFCIPPFVEQISRESFEAGISDFIEKTRKLVQKALREAYSGAVYPEQITRVLLEGGSSQMPWVKDMLVEIFNDEGKIYQSERPALDISLGATYYAAMKMGLLVSPDMVSQKIEVEFQTTMAHDIGLEIESNGRKMFYPMIRRGTPYSLAKKSHVFTLSGKLPEDMTQLDLKIMERIDRDHKIENCKLVGMVEIRNLPSRPSGKTRLEVTLMVEEEGGLVKGSVKDLGFGEEFSASGYNEAFDPARFKKRILG